MVFSNKPILLVVVVLASITNALQVMLKNNDWYCFIVTAETSTLFDVDYLVTGLNPEQVTFEARQNDKVIKSLENQRSSSFEVQSQAEGNINLCWLKTDKKSKKLDFSFKRSTPDNTEAADQETLDSITDDLKLLQTELEEISRNIMKQTDLEEEHFNLAASAASTQTWMSILKMFMVIGICVLQIYLITSYFQGNQNKRHQIDPYAQNVI